MRYNQIFYVGMILKGNTTFVLEELMKNTACIWWKWVIPLVLRTRGINSHFHQIRAVFFINSSRTVVFPILITPYYALIALFYLLGLTFREQEKVMLYWKYCKNIGKSNDLCEFFSPRSDNQDYACRTRLRGQRIDRIKALNNFINW